MFTVHHNSPLSTVYHRLSAFEAHGIFNCVPNRVSAELHSELAIDLPVVVQLHLILRYGHL